MIIGDTIGAPPSPASTVVYSPWFSRQGDAATFALQIIEIDGANVSLDVQTKNTDDADPGASATVDGTAISNQTSTSTPHEVRYTGFEELVRFKYTVKGTGSSMGFAHIRMLNPAWEVN